MSVILIATLAVMAASQNADYSSPEWRGKIAGGFVPYHQVRVEDFKVVETAPTDDLIYTTGFVEFAYQVQVLSRRPARIGIVKVTVWSGMDRARSWRRSTLKDPSQYLDHEQGHLDLNELHANRFARLTDFPQGTGADLRSAYADLVGKMNRFFKEYDSLNQREQDQYDKETHGGADQARQREWRAAINTRLSAAGITPTWRG